MSNYGDLLGKHFRILEICSGGMGEVFICEIINSASTNSLDIANKKNQLVALKTFKQQYFFNNTIRLSFEREATTWLKLHGIPHIMPVLGVEHFDNRPFILMPAVVPGPNGERSLADIIRYKALSAEAALGYAFQIAKALHHAAAKISGLVHGDLKPANVLLMGRDAFISDFGLASASLLGKPDLSLESTWAYRSPELWENKLRTPSVSSDVYAFGALLFEMLTGCLPFVVNSHNRENWANAHRNLLPQIPAEYKMNGLRGIVMNLALMCLEKDPSSRPTDFGEISEKINEIYKEHDPITHLMLLMRMANLSHAFNQAPDETKTEHIRSLLELQQYSQALDELNSVRFEEYTSVLWMHRGTTLSLLDRDSEALECFKKALAGDLSEKDRVNSQCEYGLSLKRLGRFDEAQKLYEQLITTVPDKQMPNVIINLATVYLQQEKGKEAVQLLEPFVRKHPDIPFAWANLGQSYVFEKRFQEAEKAYGRALMLAPQQGEIRVMLAAVYMDHLGQFEKAWASLDAAFDLGYQSREWLVRMLACSSLLEDEYTISCIIQGLKGNFSEEDCNEMYNEAIKMAENLVKRYSNDPDANSINDENAESTDSLPVQDNVTSDDSLSANNSLSGISHKEDKSPGLPFLNFRFYGFHDFTLDFYQSPTVPDFLESFLTEWRRATRDPRIAVGGASLRGSPFYFTQCPDCRVYVLTNRTLGYKIRCRMCETLWHTNAINDQTLDQIIDAVSNTLGIKMMQEQLYALFVCPPTDADLEVVRAACEAAEMVYAPKNRLIAIELIKGAMQRGFATPNSPWSVWTLHSTDHVSWSQDSTPAPISAVVRELQSLIPDVRTLSLTIPAEQISFFDRTIEDVMAESEKELRDTIGKGEATASTYNELAVVLVNQGKLNEAVQMARAAVAADEELAAAWENLGTILFKMKHFVEARDCLEQALFLDPTDIIAMNFLAACYNELGDKTRASELFTRAASLSGNKFPVSF